MRIEVENERTYVPKYGGNRSLADGEQIKVVHRFLLPGERKKYVYTKPIKMDVTKGTVDGNVEYIQDEEGITRAVVTKVQNLVVYDKGKKKEVKVTTGAGLYETAGVPQELVTEIELYLLTAAPEVDTDFLSEQ